MSIATISGSPGNVETALATIAAAEDLPLHLAHLQFYGYGKEGPHGFSSAAPRLAEAVNAAKNVTIDVGQVMFGQTVTISSDVLRQFMRARTGAVRRNTSSSTATPTAAASCPTNIARASFFNAVQLAVGLELFLLIDDPWRVFFTTDHPNGAPFTTYPDHLRAADEPRPARRMDRPNCRRTRMAVTTLPSISREYTLPEIATMTRAAPARLLGLRDRGHLGAGARADVAVYRPGKDVAQMFRVRRARLQGRRTRRARRRRDALPFRPRRARARPRSSARCSAAWRDYYDDRYGLRSDFMRVPEARDRPSESLRGCRMRELTVNGVVIDDTFAEAFDMRATALVITAPTRAWARRRRRP